MSMNLKTTKRNNLYLSIATVLGGFAFFATGTTYAAAPAAGTNISNIATASYVDGTSTTRTVTSNEVKTTVLQVGSFTLEQDRSATANPNGVVTLSHVLTNTGNGTDEFTLNLANVTTGDAFDFSNIAIYLDANKDGVPDNNTNLAGQKVTLNAGESVGLVVVGTTASTAKADDSGQLTLSAASGYITVPADKTKTNTDTVKIVGGAVIQVTKSANVTAVTRGDTVTYELTYKNTGNADATNLTIEDILPAGVTYVDESARWSGQTAPLTDDANDETAAKYKYDRGILTLVLASVPRNSTGKLTFQVTVNASAPAGKITNIATFDPDGPGKESPQPTNPYDVTVQSTYIGTINDNKTDTYSDTQKDISVSTKDDLITTTAVQGSPILFGASSLTEDIWIHNLGNVTETYNIEVDKSKLPPGSIVELLKSDGNTPLTDTNGDASVDSGPLVSGGHLEISARITLPSGYTGPTPFVALDTILTITPVHGTLPDKITLRITDITASKVDLSNGKGNKDYLEDTPLTGEGAYVAGNIVTTVTTKPGVAGTFPIAVTNGGSTADNYNFGTDQPLPSGWTVEYFVADSAGVCSSTKVTNTGAIQPNATAYFCAKVTPSANATPANSQDIVFTINSPATGLTDKMKDRLVVEAVRGLSFLADQQGQVAPGGTIVYKHTLTNNGNVVEGVSGGSTLPFAITHDPSTSGFVTSVYVDKNNDGIADSTELVTGNDLTAWLEKTGGTTSAFDGLSPNESVSILVKVEAPSNATAGQADLSIVTITPTGELNSIAAPDAVTVTDKTTVNIGQVRLEKLQALDADCNGAEEGNFGTSTLQAKPGACIIYQIKAVNDGNQAVTKVVITDAVPSYTTLGSTPAAALDPVSKGSVSNTANNLKSTEFALAPSETVTMKFSVKVDGQ
ncbi:hypothetical protein MF4642_02185 [Acinetobacter sp. MF4642]|uniref:DUF11 domain-containing protein n=1 Tax=Acinetobacter sp. MF4642 TaxID=1960825 RepID=UPI000995105F|nr:DUF11 domain-containing protein [Acinetobacter sp. MF4642]OOW12144.1 hypothetical protein MF4642_02185 [Acinetobacter sp. MF4642]